MYIKLNITQINNLWEFLLNISKTINKNYLQNLGNNNAQNYPGNTTDTKV